MSNENGGLNDTLLAECEGKEMSPWKARRQLAEEPGARFGGDQGRGRAGKRKMKVLGKKARWEQRQS